MDLAASTCFNQQVLGFIFHPSMERESPLIQGHGDEQGWQAELHSETHGGPYL